MKDAILFLAGPYQSRHFGWYKRLARGKFRVAVDGGYRFFVRSRTRADLLIGDLDSLARAFRPKGKSPEVVVLPRAKDKTDAEAALDYCLERGATRIDIVQPTVGEIDHYLANLFLLTRRGVKGARRSIRIVGPHYEISYLRHERHAVSGAVGRRFSVIPLSARIALTCRGTEYDVTRAIVRRGQTRASRNRIVAPRAVIEVAGEALLWFRFEPGERR